MKLKEASDNKRPKFSIGDQVLYKKIESAEGQVMCIEAYGISKKVPLKLSVQYFNGLYYCTWIDSLGRKQGSHYREENLTKIGRCQE